MGTDFFDSDLEAETPRVVQNAEYRMQNAEGGAQSADGESYHARNRREMPENLARAGDEIERLKQKQEALEKRKQEIIELRRRVDMFEGGRRDILDKLRRDAVLVVREGEQASRTAALCSEAGALFSRLHRELEELNPDAWGEEEYGAKLTEALAKVEAATAEHRKAMDRVAAVNWSAGHNGATLRDGAWNVGAATPGGAAPQGFGRWFMAGLAFSLPLALLAAVVAAAVIVATRAL